MFAFSIKVSRFFGVLLGLCLVSLNQSNAFSPVSVTSTSRILSTKWLPPPNPRVVTTPRTHPVPATSSLSLSWLDFVPQILPGKGTSTVETGIEAALILTDDHSKEIWKENFRKENPGIPAIIVDKCADILSDAFQNIAPAQVKAALKPGGLKKIRPSLEESIVSGLEKNTVIQGLLFGNADRRELLKYMVSKALDYLLKDAETILAEPATKLIILDASREDIKKSMSTLQLFWYRVRHFPKQMLAIGVASVYISYTLYQQTKETVLVTTLVGTLTPVWQWGRKVSLSFLSGLLILVKTMVSKTYLLLFRLVKGKR